MASRKITRRRFIGGAAAAATAFTIVPAYVLGNNGRTPPSEKLNVAGIGVGGQGAADLDDIAGNNDVNVVALCDVDENRARDSFSKYPQAKKYHDFRVMLEKEKSNIDAVIVATPDHVHALAAMMALKMGKHVYCEKPLTHSVYEARQLAKVARETGLATQMGNQAHANEELKLSVEVIKMGLIGKVGEVHAWSDRPIWPQGIDRPKDTPAVPESLQWDLWLGPAPERPYHPAYLPFSWRGWWDFGTGALGDMGCHIIDPVVWALDLGSPTSIEAVSTKVNSETAPVASIVRYEFPARGELPPVKLTWWDGHLLPPRPEEMEDQRKFPDNGVLYIGDKGKILAAHGSAPRLLPEERMKDFRKPEAQLPRGVGHRREWINACKGGPKPLSNFEYAGPLSELVLLGNVALRTGQKIYWDGPGLKVSNVAEADQYIRREYRSGWTL